MRLLKKGQGSGRTCYNNFSSFGRAFESLFPFRRSRGAFGRVACMFIEKGYTVHVRSCGTCFGMVVIMMHDCFRGERC